MHDCLVKRIDAVHLVALARDGTTAEPIAVPDGVRVIEPTVAMYRERGFVPPWIAYFAQLVDGHDPTSSGRRTTVGTCAFTSPPIEGRVEIAYFTFPAFEHRGVATAMAKQLVAIARANATRVFARTLRERTASTAILEKLGFTLARSIDHPEDGPIWEWELA